MKRGHLTIIAGLLLALWLVLPVYAQDTDADERALRWSPDGTRIAFISNRTGQPALYVMDADGGNVTVVVQDYKGWLFEWSPDGTQIAYSMGEVENLGLYIVTVATGDSQPIAVNEFSNWLLAWMPDGASIAYDESQGEERNGKLYSLENQTHSPLAPEAAYFIKGAESPDGSQYAFLSFDDDAQHLGIRVYDVPTETLSDNLLEGIVEVDVCCHLAPQWSPDGTQLAFPLSNLPIIYGIDLATGELETLVDTGVPVAKFAWLADGRILYLVQFRDETTLQDYDGSTPPGLYVTLPGETPQLVVDGVSTWFFLAPDEQHLLLQNFYTGSYHGKHQPRALELIDLTTFDIKQMDVLDLNSYDIRWSPDSTRIAASLCVDGDADIFIIDGVSGTTTNITPDDAFTGEPVPTECGGFG